MSELKIIGIVYQKLAIQTGIGKTGNEWKKQDFVVDTDEKYPVKICFTAWGKTVHDIQNLSEGAKVTVHFNLSSREYNDRWYSEIKAWKIEAESAAKAEERPNEAPAAAPADDTDLPF